MLVAEVAAGGRVTRRKRVKHVARMQPVSGASLVRYGIITFCVSRRRRKMYRGHSRLSVCLSEAVRPHYCMDPDVTWGVVQAAP